MAIICSFCENSLSWGFIICVLFCMSCYSSIRRFKSQGPLPTQQRVTLISVADEVCHPKHAEEKEKKKKDVSVKIGKYWKPEGLALSSQKASFSNSNRSLSPDSRVQMPRGREQRSSYLVIESPINLSSCLNSEPDILFKKCLLSLHL